MRKVIFIASLSLMIASCKSYYDPPTTLDPTCNPNTDPADYSPEVSPDLADCFLRNYTLKVDSCFNNSISIVYLAWDEWKAVLGHTIKVSITDPSLLNNAFDPCTIKVMQRNSPPNYLGWTQSAADYSILGSSRIWINPNLDDDTLHSIALHEFGHSLGLAHSLDPKSIMFATVPIPGTITCQDKINVCHIWGCVPSC